jgi:N-acetylmuramic acid 6-phosphate (MurNAc-6-P) etherase
MGFSRQQAEQALQQAGNDVQAAIALLVGGH